MGVASGFAWLGKWQLERAIVSGQANNQEFNVVVPLESLAQPGGGVTDKAAGHLVSTTGALDRSTLVIINDRLNDGKLGYWLAGRVQTEKGALATALGWGSTLEAVTSVKERMAREITPAVLSPITGRFMPSENPAIPKASENPYTLTTMAVAQLLNVWPASASKIYGGYLVAKDAPQGLTAIYSIAPVSDASYNLLNLFYAIEWLVFAGFAFFMWYRLVRDRVEREEDEAKQNQPAAGN
jgi:surfeit locus 1 family protein